MIPFSVRSKVEPLLELSLSVYFPVTHAFVRICILYKAIYIQTHDSVCTLSTYIALRVMHFSAFIVLGFGLHLHTSKHDMMTICSNEKVLHV